MLLVDEERVAELLRLLLVVLCVRTALLPRVELWLRTVLFLLLVLVLRCGVLTLLLRVEGCVRTVVLRFDVVLRCGVLTRLLRVDGCVRTVALRFDVVLRCGVATPLLLRGALSDRTVLLRFVEVLFVAALGVA